MPRKDTVDEIFSASDHTRDIFQARKLAAKKALQETARRQLVLERSQLFEERGDPLHAWETIKLCIEYQLPFPSNVLKYLLETGDRLLALTRQPKRATDRVVRALGFANGRAFAQYNTLRKREKTCFAFARAIVEGKPFKDAVAEVCREFSTNRADLLSALQKFFPARRPNEPWEDFFSQSNTDI